MDIAYLGLREVAERIRRRELTSVEVTETLLARITRFDGQLNAVMTVMADAALEQARQADAEIAGGFWRGPLHGVPLGLKDLHWTKGVPTTGGMEILRDFRPDEDATVVARFRRAGAVLIAKLHMTEGALLDHHPAFPRPANPWGVAHWTGVSSSGSGVAVAAGYCYGATGTDTGGSIRMPSAANNLTGIKPTWGRVSRHGLVHLSESMDHIGPMARSALDAALMLRAMAGADPLDPTALTAPVPDYADEVGRDISGLTIGIDWDYATGGLDTEIGDAMRRAAATFAMLGADLREVRVPWDDTDMATAQPALGAEVLAAHAQWFPRLADHYGPHPRAMLEANGRLDAVTVANAYLARDRLKGKLAGLFGKVDLLLLPGLGQVLPTWDEMDEIGKDLPRARNVLLRFNAPFNLTGAPTISFPGGFSAQGLPLGLQLAGPHLSEPLLIRAASAFQSVTDYHTRRPPLG